MMRMNRSPLSKNSLLPALLLLGGLCVALPGCNSDSLLAPEKLAPPLGLRSVTGNGKVTLIWAASNYGEDRKGFQVFQASGPLASNAPNSIPAAFSGNPVATLANTTSAGEYTVDVSNLTNGSTYSFLVVAYKNDGASLSDLSNPSNIVSDTPRAETPNTLALFNGTNNVRYLDVATLTVGSNATAAAAADVKCESFDASAGQRTGIVAQNGARIAELGFHGSFDEVDKAPVFGESSYVKANFSATVKGGYAYAVYTADHHYAKIWVISVNEATFDFTCRVAYQSDVDNPELKPGRNTIER